MGAILKKIIQWLYKDWLNKKDPDLIKLNK